MTRRLVAVLLGALVVGGCSAEADPTPEPSSVTTAPSPEQTPFPTRPAVAAPEPPAEMSQADVEGAEAAAEYYFSLLPYIYATGDLSEWEELSHPDCGYCTSVADEVHALTNGGGYMATEGSMAVEGVGEEVEGGTGVYVVELTVTEPASLLVESSGAEPAEHPETTYFATVGLIHDEGHWKIRAVEAEEA